MISEPPGEPYYIGRIMEFVAKSSTKNGSKSDGIKDDKSPKAAPRRRTSTASNASDPSDNYMVRVNWFYRPKDISKKSSDSRLLYATMHSDLCPLASVRGKCTVTHKEHVEDLQQYRCMPNCFWFDKLFDRYIVRFYEVVPTEKIINIPLKLQKVLQERFKYAIVEIGKSKELCSTPKNCEKCSQWCSPEDSVQCAHCKHDYHMLCVDPPLFKKPTRGFGWSCAVCSGALERKLQENQGLTSNRLISTDSTDPEFEADKVSDDMDLDAGPPSNGDKSPSRAASQSNSRSESPPPMSRYEELDAAFVAKSKANSKLTEEQVHQLKMWPFRYLGMHAKLEDVLDSDDRVYPRAASRLGSRHQANIPDWPGRPVVYYEPEKVDRKSKKAKSSRRQHSQPSSGSVTATGVEIDPISTVTTSTTPPPATSSLPPKSERPPWMQERPVGYIERGGDITSTLMWKNPSDESIIDSFLEKTSVFAQKLKMAPHSPNFIDSCLKAFMSCGYDSSKALAIVATFTRKSLKEPTFTNEEKLRFEQGVQKYGSELHPVFKEVHTKKSADIVRYYYLWKKTARGHEIWDNFEGRKNTKKLADVHSSDGGLADDIADSGDDSAYDGEKSKTKKRTFTCKFCHSTSSREWRRAPGYPVASESNPVTALCIRCARLWRRYAVVWEDPEEVMKKLTQRGGGGWKRKVEEELIEDSRMILAEREKEREREKTRKKIKVEKQQKEKTSASSTAVNTTPNNGSSTKAKSSERNSLTSSPASNGPEIVNNKATSIKEEPGTKYKFKEIRTKEGKAKELVKEPSPPVIPTISRPCSVCGDLEPSQQIFCQSCGLNVHANCYGIVNSPSSWLCDTCSNDQKPCVNTLYTCSLCPVRETNHDAAITGEAIAVPDALKRTFDNNWAHVRCAVWTPELKFTHPEEMQAVEGINKIPKSRFKDMCSLCGTINGACISCPVCHCIFHVGCAARRNYTFGFELQHVKSSRRDLITTAKFRGETACMNAVVMCLRHEKQAAALHPMNEIDSETGKTALQIYCEAYKRADNSVTGAMKRAMMYSLTPSSPTTTAPSYHSEGFDASVVKCYSCNGTSSPIWWPVANEPGSKNCHQCYWKAKDPISYQKAFSTPRLNILRRSSTESECLDPRERASVTNLLNHVPVSDATNLHEAHEKVDEVRRMDLNNILIS